jgi:hypothetical protein
MWEEFLFVLKWQLSIVKLSKVIKPYNDIKLWMVEYSYTYVKEVKSCLYSLAQLQYECNRYCCLLGKRAFDGWGCFIW